MANSKEEIKIGHVVIINLDEKERCGYSKRLEVDFDGPYLSMDKFDELREAIEAVFIKNANK